MVAPRSALDPRTIAGFARPLGPGGSPSTPAGLALMMGPWDVVQKLLARLERALATDALLVPLALLAAPVLLAAFVGSFVMTAVAGRAARRSGYGVGREVRS